MKFWIEVRKRDLAAFREGEYSVDPNQDRQEFYTEDNELEEVDLTSWFYTTIEKLKAHEKNNKNVVFEIRAFPGNKFHYCEARLTTKKRRTILDSDKCISCLKI